jgi:hypothetical protein
MARDGASGAQQTMPNSGDQPRRTVLEARPNNPGMKGIIGPDAQGN